jgi:hypothetical protein
LCEACNYAKSTPGWSAVARPDGSIETTTPTGHTYVSDPPVPPISSPWPLWMPQPDIVDRPSSAAEGRILDFMIRRAAA